MLNTRFLMRIVGDVEQEKLVLVGYDDVETHSICFTRTWRDGGNCLLEPDMPGYYRIRHIPTMDSYYKNGTL